MPRSYDDERPKKKKLGKKKKKKSDPALFIAIGVGVLALIVVGGGITLLLQYDKSKNVPGASPAKADAVAAAPRAGGVKYVPHESEKKFEEYRKANPDKQLTDQEVFAIMGEPTRTEAPVTVVRNGMTLTLYEVYWEVPGSGISSQMGFVNGVESGAVIGLIVKPAK